MDLGAWWKSLWVRRRALPPGMGGGLLLQSRLQPARRGTIELQQSYRTSPWLHVVVSTIGEKCSAATRALRLYDAPDWSQERELLRPDDPRTQEGSRCVAWPCGVLAGGVGRTG